MRLMYACRSGGSSKFIAVAIFVSSRRCLAMALPFRVSSIEEGSKVDSGCQSIASSLSYARVVG